MLVVHLSDNTTFISKNIPHFGTTGVGVKKGGKLYKGTLVSDINLIRLIVKSKRGLTVY